MRTVPVLLALLVALGAGAARGDLGGSMDAPAWTPGDYWEYVFNTTFQDSVFLNGTVRADIRDVRSGTVRGVTQDVFAVDARGSGTLEGEFDTPFGSIPATGTWNLTGEEFIAASSHKIVKAILDISAAGTVDLLNAPFTLRWVNTTQNVVVSDGWAYPVPRGRTAIVRLNSSWSNDVFLQVGADPPVAYNDTVTHEYDLRLTLEPATENLTVPAGGFDTFSILEEWPDGATERFSFAPGAGNNARTVSYNGTGEEVSRTELRGFRYAAASPAGWPVALLAGILVAIVAGITVTPLLRTWIRRRRRRDRDYTPPSLRDPPT